MKLIPQDPISCSGLGGEWFVGKTCAKCLPTTGDVKDIITQYLNNEVRASTKYEGKLVFFGGSAREIRKDFTDEIVVEVVDFDDLKKPFSSAVYCRPDENQSDVVSTLNKGDPVFMTGKVGKLIMKNLMVTDCKFSTIKIK